MQKFYCDNCGTKVSRNTTKCPHCGRYFKSVKCPSCGMAGSPDLFVNGCPSCGYAEEKKSGGLDFYDLEDGGKTKHKNNEDRSFSERFYKRAIPILVVVIILLIIILFKTGW